MLGLIVVSDTDISGLKVTSRQARFSFMRMPKAFVVGVFIATLCTVATLLFMTTTPVHGQDQGTSNDSRPVAGSQLFQSIGVSSILPQVNVGGPELITATLSRSALTLQEGRASTIRIDLNGDLSSLVDGDTTTLTIEARPVEGEERGLIYGGHSDTYLPAEWNDYELTPVTIDRATAQATFRIRAVDDNDYDPLESVMLELASHSDDIEIGSPNSLKLKIGDNDPRPFVSFSSTIGTQRTHSEYVNSDIPGSSVPEGEQRDFRVVLDRKSNRDVEFFIAFSGRPHLFSNDNEELVLHSGHIWTYGYLTEQGYRPGNSLNKWSLLRIPAGELGTTFTVDTRSAENDLYDYYWDRTISFGWLYVDKDHYAYTDRIGARHNFFIAQDEPAPKLLLKSSAADDDGDASITVSEGDSFDVWVDVSHQFGTSVLFDEPEMNLKAQLIATAVTGAISNLDLPDVYIGAYQSGVTITVQIPYDSLSNGERTVALGFGDVVQLRRGTGNLFEVPARVGNRLIVNVQDVNSPVASLSTSMLTLAEGQTATITIDLDGDLSSLVDGDTTTLTIKTRPVEGVERGRIEYPDNYQQNGEWKTRSRSVPDIYKTADRNDYELTPVTINRTTGEATFEIRAVDDSDYDPLESVMLELVSRSDDIKIISANSLKLKISNDDPRPFLSFASTFEMREDRNGNLIPGVFEGETGTFRVVLDRKSNRNVDVGLFSASDSGIFFNSDGMRLQGARTGWGRYLPDFGITPGNITRHTTFESYDVYRIQPGELSLTFIYDASEFDNDFYEFINQRDIGRVGDVYLYSRFADRSFTNREAGRISLDLFQDEPVPKLSFNSSAYDDDGNPVITAREGESFDVWVGIDPELGLPIRKRKGIRLEARLEATAVTGEIPDLRLPNIDIRHHVPGTTITVRIPDDGLLNGERTVALDFENAKVSRPNRSVFKEVSTQGTNRLIVKILDDELPAASLDAPTLTLLEGQTGTIRVNLRGDIRSLAGSTTTLTLEPLPGETNVGNYYELTPISVGQGGYEANIELRARDNTEPNPDQSVNLRLVSSSDDILVHGLDELTLNILDDEVPRANLSTSELTLVEGRVETITIDLSGDLSSLVDGDTTTLTIKARPVEGEERGLIYDGHSDTYLPAERNDYELTPVTINRATEEAMFEIRTVDDSDYDPLESVRLELISRAGNIRIDSPDSLKLKIGDNDPRPFVSFSTTLTTAGYFDGSTLIKLLEGDKGTFRVVLDRESNRDVELIVYSEKKSSYLLGENGESLLPYDPNDWQGYRGDMGYWPASSVEEWGLTRIPAGELGLTFTVDTKLLDNDLYDYIDEDYFGTVYLYMSNSAYAYTDGSNGRVYFRVLQDEPIPELSFRSADDGDATITVREGESFDVWIDIDPLLGRYHRVWDDILPGISLASQLTATAVIGEVPAWELPDFEIVPGQPGVTVMVQVPADSLANGERTVVLDFENALLSYTRSPLTAPARIKNSLVVNILDDEPLEASLSTSMLTLTEGQTGTIRVNLRGDIRSLAGSTTTLTLEPLPGETNVGNYYELTPISVGQGGYEANIELRARDNTEPNPDQSVNLRLVSSSDDVQVVGINRVTLNILDDVPRAKFSTTTLTLSEGQTGTITVDLSGDISSLVDGDTTTLTIEAHPVTGRQRTADRNDYKLTPVAINRATGQASFEIRAGYDNHYDPGESVKFRLISTSSEDIKLLPPTELQLDIIDSFVYASITTSTVNLEEGHRANIEIQLKGDLTSVRETGLALTVTLQHYLTAEREDYRLTAVTIDETAGRATVGVLALDDGQYDPAETALLEFGSATEQANVRWVGSNLVTLNIADNGEEPFISFKGVSSEIQTDEIVPYLTVPEGGTGHFRAELNYPAGYDITFTPILSAATRLEGWDRFLDFSGILRGYEDGEGWSGGFDAPESHAVTIPAGELGVDFTFNTEVFNNGIFEFLGTREITSIHLSIRGSAVRTDWDSSVLALKYSEGDIPELLFDGSGLTLDHTANPFATVTEGDSFDIPITLSVALGDGFEIEATLTATTVLDLDLELPAVTIGSSQPGTHTLEIPDDSITNPQGVVKLSLLNAMLKEIDWPNRKISLEAPNHLTLNVRDNETATVSLGFDSLKLGEGLSEEVGIALTGDLSSLVGSTDILTLKQQSGDAVEGDDYTLTPIVIREQGGYRVYASFEVRTTEDEKYELDESAVFELQSSSPDIIVVAPLTFTLEIPENDFPRATLSTSELTLMEGIAVTVKVQLKGDISPLLDGRGELELELLSDSDLSNDYTLTPITINAADDEASFEIAAVNDSDYDPGEQVILELKSPWDALRRSTSFGGAVAQLPRLILNIEDNDEQPLVSFTSESRLRTDDDGTSWLEVTEGEQAQFKLALNHKTNYDLRFSVFLDSHLDNSRVNINDVISTTELETIPVDDDHQQQYSKGLGWTPGYDIPESEWLTIPAGELSIDFTFDTAQLDDDLYDFFERKDIATIYLALQESTATIERGPSSLNLRYTQDELLPELSFEISDASLPADPIMTVVEGASFTLSIASSVPIGSDLKIKADLTANVLSGVAREWQLPAVEITPDGRQIMLILQVPEDDRANGDSEVRLELTDATLEESVAGTTLKHQLGVPEGLTLKISDDDFPRAALTTTEVDIEEGHSATVTVEIGGDTSGVIGDTLELVAQPNSSANANDYRIEPSEITINEDQRSAVFTLYADDEREYDPDETVVFKLVSPSGAIQVESPVKLTLNILDDSPRASLGRIPSTAGEIYLTIREGESDWIDFNLAGAAIDSIPTSTIILTLEPQSGQNAADYTITPSRITLADALVSARFNIRANDDNIYEKTETVVLRLTTPSPDLLIVDPTEIVLTIEDNDPLPLISFVGYNPALQVMEGASTTVDLALNRPSSFTITVQTRVVPGDSEMLRANGYYPEDFDQLISPNPIIIPPGETHATIVFDTAPIDNLIHNRDLSIHSIGWLQFQISDGISGQDPDELGVDKTNDIYNIRIVIIDDDDPYPTLSLTRSRTDLSQAITVNEGDQFEVWVGLSNPFAETTLKELTLTPLDGPIMSDGSPVTIAPGSYGEMITLTVADDGLFMGPRTVELSLNNRVQIMDGDGSGEIDFEDINTFLVTIMDDDAPRAYFGVPIVSLNEGEIKTVSITLEGDTSNLSEPVSFELRPRGDHASDVRVPARVTIDPAVGLTAEFKLEAISDNRYDPDEMFSIELLSLSSAVKVETGPDLVVKINTDIDGLPTIGFVNAETRQPFNLTEKIADIHGNYLNGDYIRVFEGESTTIGVQLSHPSKHDITVGLFIGRLSEPYAYREELEVRGISEEQLIPISVTIAAGETYTTIIYGTSVLEDSEYYIPRAPEDSLITEVEIPGRPNEIYLGELLFRMDSEIVRIAERVDGGYLPLVVEEDDPPPPPGD